MKSRILSVLLIVAMLLSTFPSVAFATQENSVAEPISAPTEEPTEADDIVIFYTNDVHTYIDKNLSYDTVAALKAESVAAGNDTLLVDAGDHAQGTAYGSMDKGEHIIALMNAAGYDYATLGNHEFDYGMDGAMNIIDKAEYKYLSANFYHERDGVRGENVLDAYSIVELEGRKVAIIGITTPETFTKSTPAYFQDENGNYIYGISGGVDGADLYADVQAAIDAAKAEGAEIVIALGHLGDDPASDPWNSEDVIANTTGLDAFIDGHSHSTVVRKEVVDKEGNIVVLTQAIEYFDAIGKMTIKADGTISNELIIESAASDAAVSEAVEAWKTEVDTLLETVIAKNEIDFRIKNDEGTRLIRSQETNLGDFTADALYYLFDNMDMDVDVAIMNGGGIRANMPVGDVSYKTTKNVHTFGNVACLQTITGQQLLDALEWGAKNVGVGENGGFLQVSGITYEIHSYIEPTVQADDRGVWCGAPTGEYRVKNVKVAGEDLDLSATYNLAGYNYTLRDLGDGFAMFDGAVNVLDYVMEDYFVLANYAKSFPEATIKADNSVLGANYADINGEGRITIYTEAPKPDAVDFAALKDGDVISIVMHAPATDKDYVLLNNFGSLPASNASVFEGSFDETMCWTVKLVDGQVTLINGGVGLYGIDNNNGLRADNKSEPSAITMDASGYLSFTDPSGNVRYIGVYDNNMGDTALAVAPNFRCYKNYTNNTKSQTTTIYRLNGYSSCRHIWNSGTVTLEPTCSVDGEKIYHCILCNESRTESLPALGHSFEGNICTVCGNGQPMVVQMTDSYGDGWNGNKILVYEEDVLLKELTISTGSSATESIDCRACKNYRLVWSAGSYVSECSFTITRGDETLLTVSDASSLVSAETFFELKTHQWGAGEVTLAPTCTEEGVMTYICISCGESKSEKTPAPGHSWDNGEVTLAPTCAEEGVMAYTCTVCGTRKGEAISKLEHTPNACGVCMVCGLDIGSYIAIYNSEWGTVMTTQKVEYNGRTQFNAVGASVSADGRLITSADNVAWFRMQTVDGITSFITEEGKYLYMDARSVDLVDEPGDYTGFILEETDGGYFVRGENAVYVSPSTGEERAQYLEYYAGPNVFTVYSLSATRPELYIFSFLGLDGIGGHAWSEGEVTRELTCTQDGQTVYTCSTCGESKTEIIPAPGHSYSSVVTEATCTTAGFTTHTCIRCSDSYTDAQTEAFGHSYKFVNNGENHTIVCADCDMSALVGAHMYFDGICLCGAIEPKEPTLSESLKFNMAISVGAEMLVNYSFMTDVVSDYTDFYLEVKKDVSGGEPIVTTYGMGEGRTALGSINHPVTGEALLYNASYSGINAKEMGDTFETTLYAIAADGTVYRSRTVVSSIKDYLTSKITDGGSVPEMKTMAVDMLKYGAVAQIHFDYDVENLVTKDLTEEQLSYATKTVPEAANNATVTGEGANVTTNITVGSKVELNLSCICREVSDPTAVKCLIKDEKNKVLAVLDASSMANVMFTVKYDDVGAREMRKMITATFYEGSKVISKVLTWSVESYVAQTRANAKSTESEIALVNAMLAYGDSVAAYLTASGQ